MIRKILFGLLIMVVIIGTSAFVEIKDNTEKKYKLELTEKDWNKYFGVILAATQAISKSDLPIKDATPLIDSLVSLSNEIKSQLLPQFTEAAKSDSTNKKK